MANPKPIDTDNVTFRLDDEILSALKMFEEETDNDRTHAILTLIGNFYRMGKSINDEFILAYTDSYDATMQHLYQALVAEMKRG